MADKENKKDEIKKEEKTTKQVREDVKKNEKTKSEETDKKVEVKKEEKKSENKEMKEDKKTTEVKSEKKEEAKPEEKKFEVSKQKLVNKEKKTTKNSNKITGIITIIMVLAIVAVLTVLIVTSSDPKKSVDGFLTNLKAGDFEKAQEFVKGNRIIDNNQYSEETQKLLFDKISWKVKKTTIENESAMVEIEVTNKDFSKIVENCMKKLLSNFKAVLEGNVSEQSIEKYFVEELKSDNAQMKTQTKTIQLQKQDGKWKVVSNNELENALLPGFDEAVNALQ